MDNKAKPTKTVQIKRNSVPRISWAEVINALGPLPNKNILMAKIINRKQAIKKGCSQLNSGDILLVVGKGHETYQEIKGEKIPFSDIKIVKESFS